MTADNYYPEAVLVWLDTHRAPLLPQRTVQLWLAIDDELAPMVGAAGFRALLERCLHLCSVTFPWLAPAAGPAASRDFFDLLGTQLEAHAGADALAASRALFTVFHDLLRQLMGASLAAAVLDAAWRDRLQHATPPPPGLKSVPIPPK